MRLLHPLGFCRPLLQCPASCRLVDRMNRALSPAIIHAPAMLDCMDGRRTS